MIWVDIDSYDLIKYLDISYLRHYVSIVSLELNIIFHDEYILGHLRNLELS